ncbi:hypothetical protein CPT_Moby_016 [Stenotrophomonas phage Moby]|uniref:Uncharacterized protein n=1 Tax=Stenotrophomonas phage Moby TaxID=2601680 RepID=A0A5P8PM58_9CAUD|nr:hypothetical protein HWC58_gp016 [Stenotrophomonas phage Moby]QFR57764.1 hypothetical protein CPT_Moby_016 [Stenotrophomonas phage Moby]
MMDEQMLREAVAAYLKECHLRVDFHESHVYYDDSYLEVTLESPEGEVLVEGKETLPQWERSKRSDW